MDGHHLGVHRERSIGLGSDTTVEFTESSLFILRARLALLQLCLHVCKGRAVKGAACDSSMLQCAAIKSRTIVIVALADNLAATHDNTPVAVVERRFRGLLEAQRQVIVRLHFDG